MMLTPEMLNKIRDLGLDPDKVMPVIDLLSVGLAERLGKIASGANGKATAGQKVKVTRTTDHGDKYTDETTMAQIGVDICEKVEELTDAITELIEVETEEEEDENESFQT